MSKAMSKGKAKGGGELQRPETKAKGKGRMEHLGVGALGCKLLFHTIPCARSGGDQVNGQPRLHVLAFTGPRGERQSCKMRRV